MTETKSICTVKRHNKILSASAPEPWTSLFYGYYCTIYSYEIGEYEILLCREQDIGDAWSVITTNKLFCTTLIRSLFNDPSVLIDVCKDDDKTTLRCRTES